MDPGSSLMDFPEWLRITHWVNVLFITLLMRSGIQILFDLPKLYWNDHCAPGSEWLKFSKREMPADRLWTSHDEAEPVSPWIALPGGYRTAGLARSWHFFCAFFWVLNGLIYVTLLFGTGEWRRLLPTSWDIVPRAMHTLVAYLSFHLPPASEYRPYDPLQQLAYAGVVFVLAPLAMLTGPLQSPAVNARYPKLINAVGGRQVVRSAHFLVLCSFVLFLIAHVSMVVITGFAGNMNHMVFGTFETNYNGVAAGLGIIAAIIGVHVCATGFSNKHPRKVQRSVGYFAENIIKLFLNRMQSNQCYSKEDISPYFRVNGHPPTTAEYEELSNNNFKDYRLTIEGLVDSPVKLTLDEIRALPQQSQITKHHCVQGWSAIAEWTGVPLKEILKIVRPLPEAKYILFRSYQYDQHGVQFYGTITVMDALQDQTILAYEMNGAPLPVNYGAPLRLRAETYVGFKMTKWIQSIEFIKEYSHIFGGEGGYREDTEYHVNLPKV